MTPFEIRANNYATAIAGASQRIDDFGYKDESPQEVLSRIYASFVIWLTASEEARAQTELGLQSASFRKHIIGAIPKSDDPDWDVYIGRSKNDPPVSSLYDRACSLWGIRIAFAHGDGDTSLILDKTNKGYAEAAPNHLPGVTIKGDRLYVGGITHVAIRTIVQIQKEIAL